MHNYQRKLCSLLVLYANYHSVVLNTLLGQSAFESSMSLAEPCQKSAGIGMKSPSGDQIIARFPVSQFSETLGRPKKG